MQPYAGKAIAGSCWTGSDMRVPARVDSGPGFGKEAR